MATIEDPSSLTWRDHWVYQLDGKGGRSARRAQYRFLPQHEGRSVIAWGLAQMDNGEIAVAGVAGAIRSDSESDQTVVAFSADQGATWSEYVAVAGCSSRPMMLAYLGGGVLSFMSSWEQSGNYRWYSHDYGRTWSEKAKLPPAPDGKAVDCEGNSLLERDKNGTVVMMAETGATESKGPIFEKPICGCIRWSRDGGRTWENFSWPEAWQWQDTFEGERHERGVCEGGLVRAANGWIVAALRMDPPIRFARLHYDNFMGTAVSISKDDGKSWSDLNVVFGPGRQHANLLRSPNGDLVMTVIRRLDLRQGELASYRRGCDAVVSRDNGLSWDVDRMYILDDFAAIGSKWWYEVKCGHLFSIGLDDGRVLTTFGYYDNAAALVLWRP